MVHVDCLLDSEHIVRACPLHNWPAGVKQSFPYSQIRKLGTSGGSFLDCSKNLNMDSLIAKIAY